MSIEAMKQALDALELLAKYENPATKIQIRKPKDGGSIVTMYPHKVATEAAALLRERLAQPDQEPVAWLSEGGDVSRSKRYMDEMGFKCNPLYTAPPKREWVGLTDDEIQDLSHLYQKFDESNSPWFDRLGFAKAIEEALKDKNA
jgi:hypothetical protein